MAKRVIDCDFWKDSTVLDEYSVEDKYFMLYLFTCPNSELIGLYKLPIKIISFETGYTIEVVRTLLDRFENKYQIIIYDYDTQEIFIKNFIKKSVVKGGKPIYDAFLTKWNQIKSNTLKLEFKKYHSKSDISNKTLKEFIAYISNLNIDSITKDNDYDIESDIDNDYDYDSYVDVSYTDTIEKFSKEEKEKLNALFIDYLKICKEKKKELTKTQKEKIITKLRELKFDDAFKVLDYSVINGYSNLYFDQLEKKNYQKSKQRSIGSTKDWNKIEERELSEEEKKEMRDIINKMGGK